MESHLVYSECLKNGNEYINFSPENDDFYDAREGELAEICYPIKADGSVLGLIGLIAFTEEQRNVMIHKTLELRTFLRSMADLIAGKYIVSQSNISLQNTVSSLRRHSRTYWGAAGPWRKSENGPSRWLPAIPPY